MRGCTTVENDPTKEQRPAAPNGQSLLYGTRGEISCALKPTDFDISAMSGMTLGIIGDLARGLLNQLS